MLLKFISLFVVEEIFNSDCKGKLSPIAKMLYINCLTHNFRDKEANLQNLNDFILIKAAIPNHNRYVEHFNGLVKAGLIIDEQHSYKFISHWIKHIELSRISQMQEQGNRQKIDLNKLEQELYASTQLIDLCGMKYHLNRTQVQQLMNQFIKEQIVSEKAYYNIGEAKKHFIYWCGNNKDKAPQEQIVNSKSKILGL